MVIFAWFVRLFWAILWQSHLMADVCSQKQSPKGWLVQLCHSLWCYYGDHQPLPLLSNTFPLFSLLNDGLKCKLFIWAYFKICQANDCIQLQFTIMMNPESLKFSSFFLRVCVVWKHIWESSIQSNKFAYSHFEQLALLKKQDISIVGGLEKGERGTVSTSELNWMHKRISLLPSL